VAKNVRPAKMSTTAGGASFLGTLFARLEAVRFHDARRLIAAWKGAASAVPIRNYATGFSRRGAARGGEERAPGEIVHSG
jgi:hypothetical protein